MAAPIGNRMFLLRVSHSTSFVCLSGKMSHGMIPTRSLILRHISQLHNCARCQSDVKKIISSRKLYGLSFVRHASTNAQVEIPSPAEVPAPPEVPSGFMPDTTSLLPEYILPNLPDLNAIGEPTLRSLGLGSNFPPGLYQKCLEYLHVHADIPWWSAIVLSAFIIRLCVFPVMVRQQRVMSAYTKHRPALQRLQEAVEEAKMSQDTLEIMKKNQELSLFMKDKKLGILQLALPMAVQMPIFVSAFVGLRKMSDLPVESLTEGGALWFTDLTLTDPFFALPVIGALALLVNFELGAETASSRTMSHGQRWFMRGISGVFLVGTSFLPSGTNVYFATTNIMTLAQATLLRTPAVRKLLNIPPLLEEPNKANKGFLEGFQDMWEKRKQKQDIVNWRLADEDQFKKAGTGPVPKTYRYNPKAFQADTA